MEKNINIKRKSIEFIIVIITFFILWIVLAIKINAAPNSSDILYYFEIGNKHIADPLILNRYVHVYLQQLFVLLAGNALQGLQTYWAFLFSGTIILIYICASFFSDRSTPIHGILSVLLFLSLPAITEIVGISFIDITAVFFTVAFIAIFLVSSKNHHDNKLLLIALGLIFFCSFKTKETTIPLTLLFIPLSFSENKFNIRIFIQRIIMVIVGILIGIVLLIIINAIYLKEPFFGLRLSDLIYYFNTNMGDKGLVFSDLTREDWLIGYFIKYAFLPTILYIISGTKNILNSKIDQKFIFLLPLALILFLVISINNTYGYQTRFALPSLAVICILATQFINIDVQRFSLGPRGYFLILTGSVLFSIAIIMLIRHIGIIKGVDLALFFKTLLNTTLTIVLLGLIFLDKNTNLGSIASISIMIALLILPLYITYKNMFDNQYNYQLFEQTIKPILEYNDILKITNVTRLYIEHSAINSGPIAITKNIDEVVGLVNLCLDTNIGRSNITLEDNTDNLSYILSEAPKYDYLLLTYNTWEEISLDKELSAIINDYYIIYNGIESNSVLLDTR